MYSIRSFFFIFREESRDAVASRRQVHKKNFLRRREATEYTYAKIPEVNFSVDNCRKRIVALDF